MERRGEAKIAVPPALWHGLAYHCYFFIFIFGSAIVIRCGFPGYCFLYPGQYTWLIGALPSLLLVCSYLAALVFGYLSQI